MATQQEIALMLSMKVDGEKAVQESARVADQISGAFDERFEKIAQSFADSLKTALKGVLDQSQAQFSSMGGTYQTSPQGIALPVSHVQGPSGQQALDAQAAHSLSPTGRRAAEQSRLEEAFNVDKLMGGNVRFGMRVREDTVRSMRRDFPEGQFHGVGVQGNITESIRLTAGERMMDPAFTAHGQAIEARMRKSASDAGVQLPELTGEEKEKISKSIGELQNTIKEAIAEQKLLSKAIDSTREQIKENEEASEALQKAIEAAGAETEETASERSRLKNEEATLREKMAAYTRGSELAQAGAAQGALDVKNIKAIVPGELESGAKAMLSALGGPAALIAGIAGAFRFAGGVRMDMERVEASGASLGSMEARMSRAGRYEDIVAMSAMGGKKEMEAKAGTDVSLKNIASIIMKGGFGALGGAAAGAAVGSFVPFVGTAIGGAIGAGAGALAGGIQGNYSAYTSQSQAVQSQMEERFNLEKEKSPLMYQARGMSVENATNAFRMARGFEAPESTSFIEGRGLVDGETQVMSAARMGLSQSERQSTSAIMARALGTRFNPETGRTESRIDTDQGRMAEKTINQLQAVGVQEAPNFYKDLVQGGMTGKGGMEASDQLRKLFEDGVSAGFDKSKMGDAMSKTMERARSFGMGGTEIQNMRYTMGQAQRMYGNEVNGAQMYQTMSIQDQLINNIRSSSGGSAGLAAQFGSQAVQDKYKLKLTTGQKLQMSELEMGPEGMKDMFGDKRISEVLKGDKEFEDLAKVKFKDLNLNDAHQKAASEKAAAKINQEKTALGEKKMVEVRTPGGTEKERLDMERYTVSMDTRQRNTEGAHAATRQIMGGETPVQMSPLTGKPGLQYSMPKEIQDMMTSAPGKIIGTDTIEKAAQLNTGFVTLAGTVGTLNTAFIEFMKQLAKEKPSATISDKPIGPTTSDLQRKQLRERASYQNIAKPAAHR